MTSLITPPVVLERSALFTPQGSKFKPDEPPGYYVRLLVPEAATQSAAWREMEAAVDDLGHTQFGSGYAAMKRNGTFRSPFRREVAGKGWPSEIALFINAKCWRRFQAERRRSRRPADHGSVRDLRRLHRPGVATCLRIWRLWLAVFAGHFAGLEQPPKVE